VVRCEGRGVVCISALVKMGMVVWGVQVWRVQHTNPGTQAHRDGRGTHNRHTDTLNLHPTPKTLNPKP
jgi:hypothetical protein